MKPRLLLLHTFSVTQVALKGFFVANFNERHLTILLEKTFSQQVRSLSFEIRLMDRFSRVGLVAREGRPRSSPGS